MLRALSMSKRPVPMISVKETTERVDVRSLAAGFSCLTMSLTHATCDGSAISSLLMMITSANSIWSTIRSGSVRLSSSAASAAAAALSMASPPVAFSSTACRWARLYSPSSTVMTAAMIASKFAASMTVTHVSRRAKLERGASADSSSVSASSCWSAFSGTGIVNVSATCIGSDMPVLSMIK